MRLHPLSSFSCIQFGRQDYHHSLHSWADFESDPVQSIEDKHSTDKTAYDEFGKIVDKKAMECDNRNDSNGYIDYNS